MKHVTLRQLRVLAAVAGEGSFSGGAKRLHLTQPAVSLHVKQLEQDCGLALLERSGRRTRPTEAGRELLRAGHAMEQSLKAAQETLSAMKGLRGGLLTVAVISTAQYFAPQLLAQFCRRHEGVKLRLDVCNREEIVHHLLEDNVDAAIMGRPPREIETDAEPFAQHPHLVLAAPGHPLARRRSVPLRTLLEEPFIVREPGSGTRFIADQLFEKKGLAFEPTLVMNSNETIKQAVIAGLGVALLSQHTVGLEMAAGMLVPLDVQGTPVVRQWYLVHRSDKRLSPVALAFRAFMLAEAAGYVERLGTQKSPFARKAKRARHPRAGGSPI